MVSAKSQTIKIDSGLVASYPFNGNANDESGNSNNGTVFGATLTSDRFGIPDRAYNFNGSGNYIKASATNLPTGTRTVSLWFYANSLNKPNLIGYGGSSCGTTWFQTLNHCNGHSFHVSQHCYANWFDVAYTTNPTGQWFHWVVTNGTGGRKMYLNGKLIGTNPVFINNTYVAGKDLSIGVCVSTSGYAPYTDGCVGWFDGKLDDVRIYDRELNPDEVMYLFQGTVDTIALNPGWNLTSFDVTPSPSNPQSVFASLIADSNLQMATGFQSQQGVFFDPAGMPFLNTLENLIPGEGYWLKVENADTLLIHGTAISSGFSINLQLGWNLIAYWPQETSTPSEAFAPLIDAGILQMVTGYEEGGKFYDPNGPIFLNTLSEIKNGFGYWMKLSADYYGFTYPGTVWNCGLPLLDWRDGRNYQTVEIGDQCWMKEGLNIGTLINGISEQTDNDTIEKHCYDNLETNCDEYGGLYQWDEMMEYSTVPGVKGICPTGWHLPTNAEWTALTDYLGGWQIAGGKLKETDTTHWQSPNIGATNSSGFTALPAGYREPDGMYNTFSNLGSAAYHWTSSGFNQTNSWSVIMVNFDTYANTGYNNSLKGLTVRCLQDNTTPTNQPPDAPSTPSPESGSMNQPSNTTLTWTCSDPENDPLTYDIYFGTENPPSLVATAQTGTTYNPGTLVYTTVYYWKIIAHDDHGNTTESPVWNFTTMQDPWQCGNSLTDTRDGQTYPTVQIGTQCWMAKNMNIGTRIDGIQNTQNNGIIEKYCYDNLETNCDVYGGLYRWDEMMQYSTTPGTSGICPTNWHLSTDSEWTALETYLGGENVAGGKLKETGTIHWTSPNFGATNSSGFTGLPGGGGYYNALFSQKSDFGSWWTSTENSTEPAWGRDLGYNYEFVYRFSFEKFCSFSVRCIKNEPTSAQLSVTPANQNVTAAAGTTTFIVSSNTSWTVEENTPWLTVSPMSGSNNSTFTVTFDENIYSSRIGQVTIIAEGGFPNTVVTITQTPGSGTCGQPFTDSRDNQVYPTVLIGNQCWMSKNLNIGARIDGIQNAQNNGIIEKYCYDNLETNCDIYGGIYQWNEMMQYSTTPGVEGICPSGWHIPALPELDVLVTHLGGISIAGGKMKETGIVHWSSPNSGATNSSGFTGLPGGNSGTNGLFYNFGDGGNLWSSSQYDASLAWDLYLFYGSANANIYYEEKALGFSARCLKNEPTTSQLTVTPSNQDVTATAGTTTFEVTSNTSWTVEENTPWLTVSPTNGSNNGTLTVTYDENIYSSRIGQVTIIADGGFPNTVVTITQAAGSWVCGSAITINHLAGAVAPIDKTVTYSTVTNIPGEPTKCWIASNLGASNQAVSVHDGNEGPAGWYWQFNRKQGYRYYGGRTPNTAWIDPITENLDWQIINDPCNIELGIGWHIPTATEWTNVNTSGAWTNWNGAWNSGLKLHAAGDLELPNGVLSGRGSYGYFYSNSQVNPGGAYRLSFNSNACEVNTYYKSNGYTVRCIKNCNPPSSVFQGIHIPSQEQIIWNWNIVSGASGYKWNTTNDYTSATDMGTAITKTETGLLCNTNYTRFVWAYNACGNSTAILMTQTTSFCGIPCPGTPIVSYGGQTYNTVQIGDQCWLRESLNIGTRVNSAVVQTNNGIIEKACFNNLDSNCNTYGGLYQWDEVMNYSSSSNLNPSGRQGICPTGWHIPSDAEWCQLTTYLDVSMNCSLTGWLGTDAGSKMKESDTIHWANPNYATNSSGFSAIPGGAFTRFGNYFYNFPYASYFWSSTENGGNAWNYELSNSVAWVHRQSDSKSNYLLSCRCLMD